MAAADVGEEPRSMTRSLIRRLENEDGEKKTLAMVGKDECSIIMDQVNYELNKEKAIAKKILAGKRTMAVEYEETGGGTNVYFDAGTYELIRERTVKFYNENGNQYYTQVRNRADAGPDDVIVDHRLCVFQKETDEKLYTVNLYNTATKALVNGKLPQLFKQHLTEIMEDIDANKAKMINHILTDMDEEHKENSNSVRRSGRTKRPTEKAIEADNIKQQKIMKPGRSKSQSNVSPNTSIRSQENKPSLAKPSHVEEVKKTEGPDDVAHPEPERKDDDSSVANILPVPDGKTDTQEKVKTVAKITQIAANSSQDEQISANTNQVVTPAENNLQGSENQLLCDVCDKKVTARQKSFLCISCQITVHKTCDSKAKDPYTCRSCQLRAEEEQKDDPMASGSILDGTRQKTHTKTNVSNETNENTKEEDLIKKLKLKEKDLKQWDKKLQLQARDLYI